MIRSLHRWAGLSALALILVLALSGAVLSVFPVIERLSAPQTADDLTVAALAGRVLAAYPGVEQIVRAPSGKIIVYWFDQGAPGAAVIDPATGQFVASADPSQTERWLTNLHRSLFLGDGGRIATAAGALAMLILSLSGATMIVRRQGGWGKWLARLRGPLAGRIHVEFARIAVIGFLLSSTTGLWLTASTFDLLPDTGLPPAFPATLSGETGLALTGMAALADVPVSQLRELSFPYVGDATDVFTLTTDRGTGFVDQGTGVMLAWADVTATERVSSFVDMLHTGQGAAALALVLGLLALGVPVLAVTGVLVWLKGRSGRARIRSNQAATRADIILLVGSEGGSTWGFAATLQDALTSAGHRVHTAAMTAFAPEQYGRANQMIVLAATYGDGAAPASAAGFLDRLAAQDRAPDIPLAVLGFGDRNYPMFCAFAEAVVAAAKAKGWPELLAFDTVDRQSPQDFARWGRALGQVIGNDLDLVHQPVLPETAPLTLISRRDYGIEVQAPTAILRFALPEMTFWQRLTGASFARFNSGDLIGIVPDGLPVPRLYSLASARRDGFIEIVVKKQPGGLCSGQLVALQTGDRITAFIRPNPGFQPGSGLAPLILIGAGTGIAPLAGFVRDNTRRRPIHLFFGMRHPDSDFFYREEMVAWQQDGRLAGLATAVSRGERPGYVQDALRRDATTVVRLIKKGARVMVCGGRDMAAGVAEALTEILAPVGVTTAGLKAQGRYVEDVY